MTILKILTELETTASTNAKVDILKREQHNSLLKDVFERAYNPMVTYGLKKIPEYTIQGLTDLTLGNGMDILLTHLASRSVTGNDAIEMTANILSRMSSDDAIVLERIIQRDLRCGTSDTLASRVWPGLVPTFNVMLAHKDTSGIKYPAYAQVKFDGMRCHLTRVGNTAVAMSRNGKPIDLKGALDESICAMIKDGETLDGELLVSAETKNGSVVFADRKTGNGILNKGVKGTISKEEANSVIYMAWDVVDFTTTIPYSTRLDKLNKKSSSKIYAADAELVNSQEEAQSFYAKCIKFGHEGAMIKNINSLWVPKRTKDLGKMKAEEVADLIIVGVEEGTGKNVGKLGAFQCETADSLLKVNVGTGLSDEDRVAYYSTDMIGKVIEVMYNQKISDKKTGVSSLFLPRFLGVRYDKNVANTLEELK